MNTSDGATFHVHRQRLDMKLKTDNGDPRLAYR